MRFVRLLKKTKRGCRRRIDDGGIVTRTKAIVWLVDTLAVFLKDEGPLICPMQQSTKA
jgi:hypothetical protein